MKKNIVTILVVFGLFANVEASVQWSDTPVTISNLGVDASNVSLTMDPSGNVVAVWIEDGVVQSATQLLSENWSQAVPISQRGASSPSIGVDASGNAYAIWLEGDIVKSSIFPFNGSWGAPVVLSSGGASSPQIAVDSSGNAVAIWIRNNTVESVTYLSGGSWPLIPDVIYNSAASDPFIAIGGGNVVAVWQTDVASVNSIYSAAKLLGQTWSTGAVISSSAHQAANPTVALDSNGDAYAAWFRYDVAGNIYNNVYGQIAAMPAGGSWPAPADVTTSCAIDPSQLVCKICIDPAGNVLGIGNLSLDGASFWSGQIEKITNGAWNPPLVFSGQNYYAYAIDCAFAGTGRGVMVWMYQDTITSDLMIAASDIDLISADGYWSLPSYLSTGGYNGFPVVGASRIGNTYNAISAWISWNGSNNVIQTSNGTGAVLQPPTNISLSQSSNDFHIFDELYNVISWQPSPSPDALGYRIYRDDIYLGTCDRNTLQFIDHNRIQGQVSTYALTSYDQFNGESSKAIIAGP